MCRLLIIYYKRSYRSPRIGRLSLHHYFTFKNCSIVPYRFCCSKYVYQGSVQLLSVGHNISQRVEVCEVFNRQVNHRQQPVYGVHVSTQTHLGMSLWQQQSEVAETADTGLWNGLTPSITQSYIIVTQNYSAFASLPTSLTVSKVLLKVLCVQKKK